MYFVVYFRQLWQPVVDQIAKKEVDFSTSFSSREPTDNRSPSCDALGL